MAEPRRLCSTCGKRRAERFYVSARGRVCTDCQRKGRRASARSRRVEQTYGLSAEDHATLMAEQDGRCPICLGTRPYNLDVDHSHALERLGHPPRNTVRGLACRNCNRNLLPAAKDNPETLRRAADYLERGVRWPL